MKSFRDILKPAGCHNGAGNRHLTGFYAALVAPGGVEVWTGNTYYKRHFGNDARDMAKDEAEAALKCDDGSLAAEELQRAVKGFQ